MKSSRKFGPKDQTPDVNHDTAVTRAVYAESRHCSEEVPDTGQTLNGPQPTCPLESAAAEHWTASEPSEHRKALVQTLKSLTLKVSLRTALLRHRILLATLVPEISMSGYRIKYPTSSSIIQVSDTRSPSK